MVDLVRQLLQYSVMLAVALKRNNVRVDKPHLSMSVRPMNYAEAYQIMQEIYHGS